MSKLVPVRMLDGAYRRIDLEEAEDLQLKSDFWALDARLETALVVGGRLILVLWAPWSGGRIYEEAEPRHAYNLYQLVAPKSPNQARAQEALLSLMPMVAERGEQT